MALPRKLKYFNVYVNGDSYLGQASELTPPKLTIKTEDYQGAGMPGSVALDLGFEAGALDMELTLGGLAPELLKLWGTPTADGVQFRFAGSYQAEDTGEAIPLEIQTRGRYTEHDPGSAKQGDDTSHKYTLKNTYCKITANNEELFELDVLNMIYRVNGVDMLEKHRANIGL
ncbi:phage major tail tube protein [Yersinia enterocolitica]|nr:phage major tail tube protein [Yersinia enterocolitica]